MSRHIFTQRDRQHLTEPGELAAKRARAYSEQYKDAPFHRLKLEAILVMMFPAFIFADLEATILKVSIQCKRTHKREL